MSVLASKLKVRCLMAACRAGRWVAIASHLAIREELHRWQRRGAPVPHQHQP